MTRGSSAWAEGRTGGRKRKAAMEGAGEALPIVLGYVPIGFAYGVLALTAGIPLWAVVAMSVIVYAGSAQFLAVSLFDQGASALTLITTTSFVNVRHVLYGSALSTKLEGMTRGRLAWVAAELTDESFVTASRAARARGSLGFPFIAALNGTAQASWVAGSLLGGVAGGLLGDPRRFGLDFAMVAMFLGLLALQVHGLRELGVAVAAAVVSLGLWLAGMGTWAVIPATLAASSLRLLLDRRGPVPGETDGSEPPHVLREKTAGGGNE